MLTLRGMISKTISRSSLGPSVAIVAPKQSAAKSITKWHDCTSVRAFASEDATNLLGRSTDHLAGLRRRRPGNEAVPAHPEEHLGSVRFAFAGHVCRHRDEAPHALDPCALLLRSHSRPRSSRILLLRSESVQAGFANRQPVGQLLHPPCPNEPRDPPPAHPEGASAARSRFSPPE